MSTERSMAKEVTYKTEPTAETPPLEDGRKLYNYFLPTNFYLDEAKFGSLMSHQMS